MGVRQGTMYMTTTKDTAKNTTQKKLYYIEIPTHVYNKRKTMYDNIKIVSWPHTVNCKQVFGCYIELDNMVELES